MKRIAVVLLSMFFVLNAQSQVKDPVSWDYKAVKKGPGIFEIVITANVPQPWHMYS